MPSYSFAPDPRYAWGGGSAGDMGRNLLNGLTNGMNLAHAMAGYDREQNTLGWDIARQNAQNRAATYDGHNRAIGQQLYNTELVKQVPWARSLGDQYGNPAYSPPGSTASLSAPPYGVHGPDMPLVQAPPLGAAPHEQPLPPPTPYSAVQPVMPGPTHMDYMNAVTAQFAPQHPASVVRSDLQPEQPYTGNEPWMTGGF